MLHRVSLKKREIQNATSGKLPENPAERPGACTRPPLPLRGHEQRSTPLWLGYIRTIHLLIILVNFNKWLVFSACAFLAPAARKGSVRTNQRERRRAQLKRRLREAEVSLHRGFYCLYSLHTVYESQRALAQILAPERSCTPNALIRLGHRQEAAHLKGSFILRVILQLVMMLQQEIHSAPSARVSPLNCLCRVNSVFCPKTAEDTCRGKQQSIGTT